MHFAGTWTRVTDGLEEVTEATTNSKLPDDTKDCNLSVKGLPMHFYC
jgi:hypothetical protein